MGFYLGPNRNQRGGKVSTRAKAAGLRCALPKGKRYGFLIVLRGAKKPKAWGLAVICRCDCTAELAVRCADLERGTVRSCGQGVHTRHEGGEMGPSDERLAAQAEAHRTEQERIALLYPAGRPPKPPRESDLAWREGGWMQ